MLNEQDDDIIAVDAEHGEKMIEIRIRFWTNDIDEGGGILPRHARTGGTVQIEGNSSHGIKPSKSQKFKSLLHLTSEIEKVLIEHNIMLHPGTRMKKYIGNPR